MTARKTAIPAEQSWDDFWAEVSHAETTTIRGVEVPVPSDMPMKLRRRVEELQDSEEDEHIIELVSLLFGSGVFDEWEDAGLGIVEFRTILTWGIAHAFGRDMTFAQALEAVRAGEEGKALGVPQPNRAARRSQSAATGGRSKRTTSASTGSARRTSRT